METPQKLKISDYSGWKLKAFCSSTPITYSNFFKDNFLLENNFSQNYCDQQQ